MVDPGSVQGAQLRQTLGKMAQVAAKVSWGRAKGSK